MDTLDLRNPAFAVYVVSAALMILKAVGMSWLTVWRMMSVKGGYRSPEDLRKTPLNPHPSPDQIKPDERVERVRRIHLNDLENVPFFLAAGFLYLFAQPSLIEARIVFYGYVLSRFAHFAAYYTAQTHDMRATFWTIGSLLLIWMTIRALLAGLAGG